MQTKVGTDHTRSTALKRTSNLSVLHLTGALDEIVPAIRALPKDFSETFDGFARPVLAVRSSRTALIARSTETDWLFASMERMLALGKVV